MCALSTITEDVIAVNPKTTNRQASKLRNVLPRSLWQNRLQFQALAGGAFVCCAGGNKWAWCVFEPPVRLANSTASTRLLHCMWFVGVVVGALAATINVQRLQKHVTNCISGFLLLMGGILFILLPHQTIAQTCSCLVEGVAYGLSVQQLLITGGEVAQRDIRATLIVSAERLTLLLGILMQLMLTQIWYRLIPEHYGSWHVNQLHGFCIACLGLLAILQAGSTSVDSPIQIYRQHGEQAATQALKQLLTGGDEREAAAVAWEVTLMRVDQQRLLLASEDKWTLKLLPFVRVLLMRCYASLSLSLPFTSAYLSLSWSGFNCDMNCCYTLALGAVLGSILGGQLLDIYGRRRVATCGALLASQLIFMVGGITQQLQEQHVVHANVNFTLATVLLLLYQVLTFAGVDAAASTYMTEAFGLRAKPMAISCVIICEAVLNIALILLAAHFRHNMVSFFFGLGWLSLSIGIFIFVYVPETQSLTLGECVNMFRRTRPSI